METLLRVEPFNGIWFDCFHNNIVSVLISQKKEYESVVDCLEAKYLKTIFHQKYDTEEDRIKMLSEGYLVPSVEYDFNIIDQLVDFEPYSFQTVDYEEIEHLIKSKINADNFVFAKVDRYFYPSGREAGTTHLVHPAFIYGYSDEEQCFYSIEDCEQPGFMNYYKIPFDTVKQCVEHFMQNKEEMFVMTCLPKTEEKIDQVLNNNQYMLQDNLKKMAKHLMRNEIIYKKEYDLYYHSGLSCIDCFRMELIEIFNQLKDKKLFGMRMLSFQQVHQRNCAQIQKIGFQLSDKRGEVGKLIKLYHQLAKKWQIFKNNSYYVLDFIRKGDVLSYEQCENLIERLQKIRWLEEEAAHSLFTL